MWTMYGHLWMIAVIATLLRIHGTTGLKNVSLEIIPVAVQRGQHVTLICHYDLEDAPLYSVKWYRGRHEFYRYCPNEEPKSKIFAFPGIHVDVSLSNASQVVLRNVGFGLSGNFSCEVTTDAPSFSTKVVSHHMVVVVLPENKPVIRTEKERYEPGDILRANCTSAPSKPATQLTFLINNMVMDMGTMRRRQSDDLFWSELHLEMRLDNSYFIGEGGRPVLKCTAQVSSPQVSTLYQEETQISLGPRVGDPIPERVRSPNATAPITSSPSLHLMMFVFISYVIR